jgi:hypothetical protein
VQLTAVHEAAVVLAGQGPEERAHVGALEEEADGVDVHPRLVGLQPVPIALERAADVPREKVVPLHVA